MSEFDEITAPAVVFPGQRAPERAYATAYDLIERRSPKEALDVLDAALRIEPTDRGLRSLRAWAYLKRAQLNKAEAELRALVEEVPDDDWPRHALGRALERQSRHAEALPHLRLAYAMSGDYDHGAAVLRVERFLSS